MREDRSALVRRFYAAWTTDEVDELLAVVHPEIEFNPILGALYEQHGFHGREGIAAHVRGLHQRWDTFTAEVEQTREVCDAVIAFVQLRASKRGHAFDARIAAEVRFRDGLISAFIGHDVYETAEALGVEL